MSELEHAIMHIKEFKGRLTYLMLDPLLNSGEIMKLTGLLDKAIKIIDETTKEV